MPRAILIAKKDQKDNITKVVAEREPKTRVSGTRSIVEKWVEGKLNKAFLHFLPNFLSYLVIFQSGAR